MPSTASWAPEDATLNKADKTPCLHRAFLPMGRRDIKQVKCIACQVRISSMGQNKVRRKGKECWVGVGGLQFNWVGQERLPWEADFLESWEIFLCYYYDDFFTFTFLILAFWSLPVRCWPCWFNPLCCLDVFKRCFWVLVRFCFFFSVFVFLFYSLGDFLDFIFLVLHTTSM